MADALAELPVRMVDGPKDAIVDAVSGGGSADGGLGDLGAHCASAKQAQSIARAMLPAFGRGAGQMPSLVSLFDGESGWRWNALNPFSGAYGIPQNLPASKMASAGPDWRTNPATQLRWGLGYIRDRYGSPAHAYSTWLSRSPHCYDEDGCLPTGLSLVANSTGAPEPVFTSSQWEDIRRAKSGTPDITVDAPTTVYIDSREIRGIVDQRIAIYDADSATALNNGRRADTHTTRTHRAGSAMGPAFLMPRRPPWSTGLTDFRRSFHGPHEDDQATGERRVPSLRSPADAGDGAGRVRRYCSPDHGRLWRRRIRHAGRL
ncbi:hypothetical protein ACIRBZ_39100 [Streptomyces sp. NPDC094038]|uniref:aggregation-promoting factor C-terminal-like domain-containing protein n=1 Tax=Streptomyces sp. NPDC094038 TaxID=3366055 RepID=UPI00382B6CCC